MDLYLPTWFRNDRSLRDAALFKIVTFCFRQRIHFVHGSAFHRLDCGRRPEDECSSLVSTVPGWPSRSDTRVWAILRIEGLAGATGLEPAASCVTGRRPNLSEAGPAQCRRELAG